MNRDEMSASQWRKIEGFLPGRGFAPKRPSESKFGDLNQKGGGADVFDFGSGLWQVAETHS